jgi:hypothetical protein
MHPQERIREQEESSLQIFPGHSPGRHPANFTSQPPVTQPVLRQESGISKAENSAKPLGNQIL